MLLGHIVVNFTLVVSVVDPDPLPDLYESASASNKNPNPHQFADDKQKFMKYEPILALFHGSGSGSAFASEWKVESGSASGSPSL
jgi:hypothetical protein